MKRALQTTILLLLFSVVNAQNIDQIKNDRQNYIWGEGTGTTLDRADQNALGMLINQISTQVESSFSLLKEEVSNSDGSDFKETFNSVIKTYSSATLRNTERIVISNEPDAKIFRFIKRADVEKIFLERKNKIIEFAKNAEKADNDYRISDALRYYYWSLTLLRSHPNANSIKITEKSGNESLLISWLPQRINAIFDETSIRVSDTKKDGDLIHHTLFIEYKNQPARNFDYSYWTGRDWSNIYSSKDGYGFVEYFDAHDVVKELRLKAEYVFKGETSVDNELRDVMSKLDVISFRDSYFNVNLDQTAKKPVSKLKENQAPSFNSRNISQVEDTKPYEEELSRVIDAINTKDFEKVRQNFTTEGYDIFCKLLQYGKAKIITKPEFEYLKFENSVMCRSLKMSFNFPNNNRSFVEDVVFSFNEDNKIQNLSFGLGEVAETDILKMDNWSEQVRLILINFLENYKTAYALKRIDYIESIFADDALIITGSVLKPQKSLDNPYINNPIIKYNRYTKEQYINVLKHSFASKEFINIRFEDNIVRKSGKGGEVYGIQIKQDYFSQNYGDTGYLFLLIDINVPDQPVIHVRTWQPDKNPDGSIYGLGDF